jgi:hypothetical protein
VTREWEDALHRGDVPALEQLLDRGADIDAVDRYSQTSVMIARSRGMQL